VSELPAWSLPAGAAKDIALASGFPVEITREWALGGSTGKGVRVCILDSGVDASHPLVGHIESAVAVSKDENGVAFVANDLEGDACGHGTACAGIVRQLAPDAEIHSVRVLGAGFTGGGNILLAGLRHAIEEGFDIVNMSLSTTKKDYSNVLHELADTAYFQRTVLVASAHNMPVESYPWRFSSVLSVGSHEEDDPMTLYANPNPPVEFFAKGVNVEVAWMGGETVTASGNSFATPHVSAICALVRSKHPELTPSQLKSVLHLTSSNVGGSR
jgi:subtilisin family serine protease